MDIVLGFLIIVGIHLWILLMDRFFKSCCHYGYLQFLKGTGLEIKCFYLTWTTTAFNKLLVDWGKSNGRFQNLWFTMGLCASLSLLPISIYILLLSFIRNFGSGASLEESLMQPVLPGINLPASEMGYYGTTLLISSVLHELGHALASVQEDVNVINVGANIFFVLPIAYVNLNADKLFSLNPWKRLKILCAGVWHNLLVAFAAYLMLLSLTQIFSPLFEYGNGIIVTAIRKDSPVTGDRGIKVGDRIVRINDCTVQDEGSWYYCLSILHSKKSAFCIEADTILDLDESVHLRHLENGLVTCCRSDEGKLCFEYLDGQDGILELPPYACLPGRTVIEISKKFCTAAPHSCPIDTYCFRPFLMNTTNLYSIEREKLSNVIFIGPVADLVRTVTVSSYIPKYAFLGSAFPNVVTKFLEYLMMFSAGLAIVNVLPCLFMDGQYITNTLFHLALSNYLRTTHIKGLSAAVTVFFTFLIVIHCVIVIWIKIT